MTTPDITEGLPSLLSARAISARGASSSVLYDVVISGIGFVFDVSSNKPYQRQSESAQKEQIDTSTEAGEQTLGGPWVRSQTSWHLGAGSSYYEPGNRDETIPSKFRFKDSRGVNPWVQGSLSLHPKMDAVETIVGTTSVCGARISGENIWFSYDSDGVHKHTPSGSSLLAVPTFTSPDYQIASAGKLLLLGGTTGVKTVDTGSGTVTALTTQALGTGCQPYWAKGRIITTKGAEIHQHSLTGGPIDATSLLFTHPDSAWSWTGVTETPDAILASGRSGGTSAIYAFVLAEDSGGSVPKLGQGFQVAEFPPGEEVRAIKSYLGRYLGIGTTAGIRIAVIGDRGQVQYGPLLVETTSSVTALAARDSFMYAATGNSVIRVNLSEPIDEGLRFPYAFDVEVPAGHTITSLAFEGVSDRVVVGSNGHGTYAASTTETVSTGWLESGSIRFGTTEPKAFRTIDVTASTPGSSSVAVSATVDGTAQSLVTLALGKGGHGISLGSLPSPLAQIGYRLDLNGGVDNPGVDAVAVKAVPLPTRQRLVLYPVQLADEGRDSKNTPYGKTGYASTVLEALEHLENSQAIVTVNDLTRPEQFEATIEQIRFTRVRGRAKGGAGNFGGTAEITLRTL